MTSPDLRAITSMVAAVLLFAVAPHADAATRYVADTGTDGPGCGLALTSACRSISQAVMLANPGDTILVGPGRYGDLNDNGILGEPGEERGAPGCGCVLAVNKAVTLVSSGGAAVTWIDARAVNVIQNVLLITDGGVFGQPGKGFTVGGIVGGFGIAIDSNDVTVRGNRVVGLFHFDDDSTGIVTLNDAPVLIEGNEVIGWARGILSRGATTVRKNQVSQNDVGIFTFGGSPSVVGNVATLNRIGFLLSTGGARAQGNAAYLNTEIGFAVSSSFSGVMTKNNMFGNGCGLHNFRTGLVATNNYWGAPTGPGPRPADSVCVSSNATTTPFATKPFVVKPLKP